MPRTVARCSPSRSGPGGDRLSDLPFRLSGDPSAAGLACPDVLWTGHSSSDVSVFDNGATLTDTPGSPVGDSTDSSTPGWGATLRGSVRPPIDNLLLDLPGATASLDDLVADCDRGLLLTCSGTSARLIRDAAADRLTRDGVYLVEHGEVVGAVNNSVSTEPGRSPP